MTETSGATDDSRPDAAAPGAVAPPPTAPSAPAPPAAPTPTAAPGSAQDWTDQVTDLIVDTVDKVRSRTTGPILDIAKGSVHAVVAVILLVPVAVLFLVLAIRVLTYFVFREVWITYAVLGMLFVLIGVVLWARRKAATTPSTR
jgi:hypothetical protein